MGYLSRLISRSWTRIRRLKVWFVHPSKEICISGKIIIHLSFVDVFRSKRLESACVWEGLDARAHLAKVEPVSGRRVCVGLDRSSTARPAPFVASRDSLSMRARTGSTLNILHQKQRSNQKNCAWHVYSLNWAMIVTFVWALKILEQQSCTLKCKFIN